MGEMAEAEQQRCIRVLVGGFDPISLLPHGTVLRANSAEGQLSHNSPIFQNLTGEEFKEYPVQVVPFPDLEDPLRETSKAKDPFWSFRRMPKHVMDRVEWNLQNQRDALEKIELHPNEGGVHAANGDAFRGMSPVITTRKGRKLVLPRATTWNNTTLDMEFVQDGQVGEDERPKSCACRVMSRWFGTLRLSKSD